MKMNARPQLRREILRSVSRSFYLSLRVLPKPLRDPLSLAYLLARATDTIADTPEPAIAGRKEALAELASAIQGEPPNEKARRLSESFAPLQENAAERTLIRELPALLAWLEEFSREDQGEIRNVLAKINRGQALDLERFGEKGEIRALATSAELDEYTYLVAGCVGEFWTRLCFVHVSKFCERPETEMLELGANYGRGLQLINILRDAGNDLRSGRCYLPAEDLHALGLTPGEILDAPQRVQPVTEKWRSKAEQGLQAGIDYAASIRNRRIRFATALPAMIGARTLALLREADSEALTHRVKVSRPEIRKMIVSSALASRRSLQTAFEKLLL